MAPQPFDATRLELLDSEVTKPQPLRIIKRSKTISGCSTLGQTFYRRSGSFVSNGGEESPPLAADGPLTVYKVRNRRAPVLTRDSHDGDNDSDLNTTENNEIQFDTHNDSNLTPKAKQQQEYKSASAGDFLKGEYYGGSLDFEAGHRTTRAERGGKSHTIPPLSAGACVSTATGDMLPKVPPRRVSKSKNFILRAIGGRSADSPKPIRRVDSTTSKTSLIHRFSHSRRRSCDSSSCQSSFLSPTSSIQPNDSMSSSSVHIPSSQPTAAFVLCPKIVVKPEFTSIDSDLRIMWVAIEVIGVLRWTDWENAHRSEIKSGCHNYGKLHSMHISLHPGQGCSILEVIGNLHQSKTIKEGDAQLILAKIRLDQVESTTNVVDIPSAKLIIDLQNHLGDTLSSYLTVRVTYKHSAFPNSKSPTPDLNGMKAHTTRLETEATATIARWNSDSAWIPRDSQMITQSPNGNPVEMLIAKRFTPEKARNIINKLSADKIPTSNTTSYHHSMIGLKGESCRSMSASKSFKERIGSRIPSITPEYGVERIPQCPVLPNSITCSPPGAQVENDLEQIDPARRIWTEMRRTSRGRSRWNTRASISADHDFSFDSSEEDKALRSSSPSHIGALELSVRGAQVATVDLERSRIMEVALRNQRSVGTETLRSIAPSVAGRVAKPKGGTISGLGLRAWGWGTPWW